MRTRLLWIVCAVLASGAIGCMPAKETTVGPNSGGELYQAQRENKKLKKQIEELEGEKTILKGKVTDLTTRSRELEKNLIALKVDREKHLEMITHLKDIPDYKEESKNAKLKVIELEGTIRKLELENKNLKTQIESLKAQSQNKP